MKEIVVGHTPDADDAFMFYGLETGKVVSPVFTFKHVIEDIETLNKYALKGTLDVTAISVYAYSFIKNHVILTSGASFGVNYGPTVLSKKELSLSQLKECSIAIPGKMTSANLLLSLVIGKFKYFEMNFRNIPDAILSDKVDAGLVIHESQITYDKERLRKIIDLGAWWHVNTDGLPVPLGINVANIKSMSSEEIGAFNSLLRDSIVYGLRNVSSAVDYAMKYSRGHTKQVMEKFIKMYVNENTVEMGETGKKAINKLLMMGLREGIVPSATEPIFA
jgi:5,8-dihydroxy-2-naphthoate synthase